MSNRYYFDSIGRTIGDNETNDFLNGYQVANLLNEQQDTIKKLKGGVTITKLGYIKGQNGAIAVMELTSEVMAFVDLMDDYNLTWEAVYNIVKESIEDD